MWGTEEYLRQLFGDEGGRVIARPKLFHFRYASAAHWLQMFRDFYGPLHKAFAALGPDGAPALEQEVLAMLERANTGGASSLVVPAEYLEVVITKRSA